MNAKLRPFNCRLGGRGPEVSVHRLRTAGRIKVLGAGGVAHLTL